MNEAMFITLSNKEVLEKFNREELLIAMAQIDGNITFPESYDKEDLIQGALHNTKKQQELLIFQLESNDRKRVWKENRTWKII